MTGWVIWTVCEADSALAEGMIPGSPDHVVRVRLAEPPPRPRVRWAPRRRTVRGRRTHA